MANRRLYQLSHCTYICEYHVVWTPKYRGKVLADKCIKEEFKRLFKQICAWKRLTIRAWHVGDEHIHLYISIPPKYSIAYAIAILKGKSSAFDQAVSIRPLLCESFSRSQIFRNSARQRVGGFWCNVRLTSWCCAPLSVFAGRSLTPHRASYPRIPRCM
ncbi:MAG: hypothetical protein UW28_C0038G0002 [Parcubacteria group bacterium GW2011_GWA2_44_13]|nr:MAG: hypothetical protein UW28_C0038G0002 [Parcubacteria group bacterium GW2011_GWA2_44_13]